MKLATLVSVLSFCLRALGQRISYAQRPDDQSICDYYAKQRYGKSNSTSQYLLMSSIVTLAYAGGDDLHAQAADDTGIFNKGSYDGKDVYLRSWFDGSKATTNLNNQAVVINWLDGGGVDPLRAYLNGSSKSLDLDKDSNQYRLFSHWFSAFGFIYGCTEASNFPKAESGSGGSQKLPPAYVHKYMDLNQTQVGYFIEQLTAASKHFGFSDSDAETLDVTMNARYNIRCAPADNGQLNSICQNEDCPLAQPTADCQPYKDITATSGSNSSSSDSSTSSSAPSSKSTAPSSSATNNPATGSVASSHSGSKSGLSGGEIAGVVIACVVVALIAIGMFLFFRRRNHQGGSQGNDSSTKNSQMVQSTVGSPQSGGGGAFLRHASPHSELSHSPHPASLNGLNHHGSFQGEGHQQGYDVGNWQTQSPQSPAEAPGDSVHASSVRGTLTSVDSPTYSSHVWQPHSDMRDRQASPTVPLQYTSNSYGGYMGG